MAEVTVDNLVTTVDFSDDPEIVVANVADAESGGDAASGSSQAAARASAEIEQLREILEPLVMQIIEDQYEQFRGMGR